MLACGPGRGHDGGAARPGREPGGRSCPPRGPGRGVPMSDKKTYTDDEVKARLAELGLADWYLEDGWIRRKYNTDGWPQTLMAVNAIGYLCEAAYHHADLAVTYAKLCVKLQTHSAGGITDKDFLLAKKIEEV